MEKSNVVAVIVTFNRKELLKEAINAILNQDYKKCDVLVIDNASTDGTKEYISDLLTNNRVIYYNTGSNIGGAGGFNIGMKIAVQKGYEYVWVMDDDCIVHNDTLTEFLKADKKLNGKYGFLTSKVIWKDNSICVMNRQKKTFSKWLKDFDTNYQTVAMASFVSLFLKSETILKYGLPIKDFFIWTDDWEFTRRISRKEKCYFISSSVVTHKCKNNIGASIAEVDGERLGRFKYLYRNDVVLYRGEGIKGWLLLYMRLMYHKIKILKSDKKNKKERIKIIDDAVKEGKKFNPEIEYVNKDKEKEINILEFFGEPLDYGGQEAFILNFYKTVSKANIEFTFATPFEANNVQLKELIKQKNDIIINNNGDFNSKLRKKYIVDFAKDIINSKYDIIHIHSGSIFTLYNVSKIAKKNGVKKVIIHSHNAGIITLKHRIIKFESDRNIEKYADYYFCCSKDAAKYMFPKNIYDSQRYKIIKNGIDLQKYKFNENIRKEIREKYKIKNNTRVLINVARLSVQKNQVFLINLMKKLTENNEKYILFLVGDGTLRNQITEKIKELRLESKIILTGNKENVEDYLSASDYFLFPSLYDGFGISALEAQANGIVTICSSNVSSEAKVTSRCMFVDGYKVDDWINAIKEFKNIEHKVYNENMDNEKINEYDIKNTANDLLNEYLKIMKNKG